MTSCSRFCCPMISAMDNCKDGSALGEAERYDLECGTMGDDFDGAWLVCRDRTGDEDECPFAKVLLVARDCPEKRGVWGCCSFGDHGAGCDRKAKRLRSRG